MGENTNTSFDNSSFDNSSFDSEAIDISDLLEASAAELDRAVALRRKIHAHPELGLELPVTQASILEELDGLPFASVSTGTTSTSVVAVLDGGQPGPTVLLRGDMDALPMPEDTNLPFASTVPGTMHACGHDSHVAMLVGAARILSERRHQLRGRVAFMFQPGEEGAHGAKFMLDDGLLATASNGAEPVSLAFAIHQSPNSPSGWVAAKGRAALASADEFRIVVTGRGGHASMPHQALDPIPVACQIVAGIQSMVTRRIDVFDPAVVTVAKIRSGTTSNVIPETAEIIGTIRAVSDKTRTLVHDELRRVAEGTATAHDATAAVEIQLGYPATINNVDAASYALTTATSLFGAKRVLEMPTPVMGAEDWSYVLQEVPGCMAFLGTWPPGVEGNPAPNHSNRMVIDEAAMSTGMALHAAVALGWSAERTRRQVA